ncbi:MAG: hypothetical protein AAF587_44720, partial [Bacteroidota bacterium]
LLSINFCRSRRPNFPPETAQGNFFRLTSAAVNASRKAEPHLVQKYTFLKDFPPEMAQVNFFSINFLAELPAAL